MTDVATKTAATAPDDPSGQLSLEERATAGGRHAGACAFAARPLIKEADRGSSDEMRAVVDAVPGQPSRLGRRRRKIPVDLYRFAGFVGLGDGRLSSRL